MLCILTYFISFRVSAEYVEPDRVNLANPTLDSIQKTMWIDYPVIIHRRTPEQIKTLQTSFDNTAPLKKRWLSYRSIARYNGNEFASAIMQFTEKYISDKNVYMSETPEFGIFSLVSPIAGCAIIRDEHGFIDPCSGVKFDFAGRVIGNSDYDHLRLTIPPHQIVENKLEFLKEYKAKEVVDFTPDILGMKLPDIDKALLAIDFESIDILKQIINENPSVTSQKNSTGSSILIFASIHDSTIDYVLSLDDIQIDHINDAGYTALLFAILARKFENAEKLILNGARIDSFSSKGITAKSLEQFIIEDTTYDIEDAKEIFDHLEQLSRKYRANPSN